MKSEPEGCYLPTPLVSVRRRWRRPSIPDTVVSTTRSPLVRASVRNGWAARTSAGNVGDVHDPKSAAFSDGSPNHGAIARIATVAVRMEAAAMRRFERLSDTFARLDGAKPRDQVGFTRDVALRAVAAAAFAPVLVFGLSALPGPWGQFVPIVVAAIFFVLYVWWRRSRNRRLTGFPRLYLKTIGADLLTMRPQEQVIQYTDCQAAN